MIGRHQDVPTVGQERRRTPRAKYLILVNFMVGGRVYSDYVQNISMGGASIRSSKASYFNAGDRISIAFPLVRSQRQIDGEIVWVSPQEFGVAFESVGVKCNELGLYESETGQRETGFVREKEGKLGRIRKKRLRWEPSWSEDVIGYKLYWSRGAKVGYDSQHADLGNVTEVMLPDDVPSFPSIAGEINLGIAAVNEAGNESALTEVIAYFNFSIPEAPKAIEVEDVAEQS